jgi:hypothetical protein
MICGVLRLGVRSALELLVRIGSACRKRWIGDEVTMKVTYYSSYEGGELNQIYRVVEDPSTGFIEAAALGDGE